MATEHLTATIGICDLFHDYELELCPDEIRSILQTLDDNYNTTDMFNMPTDLPPGPLMKEDKKISINYKKNKRMNNPAKTASLATSLEFDPDENSNEDHAMISKRKSLKRQRVSPPSTSTEDGSGEDGGGAGEGNSNGKVISHITVERNRRKQINEHLDVLRQLMPSFYAKKGDQASIVGGVIDYINELHQVLQSLLAKKRRKTYTNEVGLGPMIIATSPRLAAPHQNSNLSPVNPRTPLSTNSYKHIRQPLVQPSSITSPTINLNSYGSSAADIIMTMKSHNKTCNNANANELVASSKSSVAVVDVKFCGPNLEVRTLSSKLAGQSVKIVSAIEDLALEVLQVNINTVEETLLNIFTIKIGTECQLSAEELAQHIQETFC